MNIIIVIRGSNKWGWRVKRQQSNAVSAGRMAVRPVCVCVCVCEGVRKFHINWLHLS